jgi:RNA polymerase sigma-70 factor (ECF subfamily)
MPAAVATGVPLPRPARDAGPFRAEDVDTWLVPLRATGEERELAIVRLHALLLRAARFEAARRRPTLSGVGGGELDDLVLQAADDALVAVLARLDTFRGASRFTTWAYKFGIYQTAVLLRRRAWRDREVRLTPESWAVVADRGERPEQHAETAELLAAVRSGIAALTPHQRLVLVAVTVDDVPIDVLAERLGSTRGALYKTLHDARRRLRGHLAERDLLPRPATAASATAASTVVEEIR